MKDAVWRRPSHTRAAMHVDCEERLRFVKLAARARRAAALGQPARRVRNARRGVPCSHSSKCDRGPRLLDDVQHGTSLQFCLRDHHASELRTPATTPTVVHCGRAARAQEKAAAVMPMRAKALHRAKGRGKQGKKTKQKRTMVWMAWRSRHRDHLTTMAPALSMVVLHRWVQLWKEVRWGRPRGRHLAAQRQLRR